MNASLILNVMKFWAINYIGFKYKPKDDSLPIEKGFLKAINLYKLYFPVQLPL